MQLKERNMLIGVKLKNMKNYVLIFQLYMI